ncbi:MAG: lysophospholipid acyltransferase family protein [Verrucomicrobiae bacterium]|nr:lysophospholipid acyltransferase family protein [Verrucomicrobiae bacterium]
MGAPVASVSITTSRASRWARVDRPAISRAKVAWFGAYAERYVARHFHAVRVAPVPVLRFESYRPLVVYLNHPSWWDPMIGLVLARRFFSDRCHYAPIESAQLERYRVLRGLGFFGIEKNSMRGAAQFLRVASAVLENPSSVLWVTAQGRFADVRERPLRLEAGVEHLARRLPDAWFVPLALEYTFWTERCAEALARWGEPRQGREVVGQVETELQRVMDELAQSSRQRRAEDFAVVLRGRAGVGGCYDVWRAWRARWRGESFAREHGADATTRGGGNE